MKPLLGLTVIPDKNSDYVTVCLTASVTSHNNVEHDIVLYLGVRLAQGLSEDMSVDAWALATFADHARAIEAAITDRITNGETILTLREIEQQISLF